MNFLIDTNVVFDVVMDRKPFSQSAARLLDLTRHSNTRLFISSVSYCNLYYVLRKLTTHKETINLLKHLHSMTETVAVTDEIIMQAMNSDFRDFEDAIQYFSAKNTKKIDAIVTRNLSDYKHSKLSVLSPDEAISLVKSKQ